MLSFFNCCNTGFDVSDVAKYPNHGDMLGTYAFQIKDPDISGFFGYIGGSDHVYDFALNQSDRSKWNLSFGKNFFADSTYPLA